MWSSSPRDNWARLVEAVVKREQIRQLFHQDSITTASSSFRSDAPSHLSEEVPSASSSRSKRISVTPPHQRPFTTASGIEFRKSASRTSTWKLFSALTRRMKLKDNNLDDIPEVRARRFSLPELQFATDNFHNENILGRGSHGYLYKGILEDGSLVAVKRLTADFQEIGTELDVASIATHRNVLYARGFCFTEKERLIVFPYMPNGSVASWLRERQESLSPLIWPVREKIALGAAKGLAYLHYECPMGIIHLDIKAENVLLDEGFEAVVADFNLAKFMDCYNGDVGRLAPVYDASGNNSVKGDVFGYGVFLLELITAQNSSEMLPDIVKRYYKEGTWKSIIDANLPGVYAEKDVEKLLQMALICTQTDEERRPTMLEVVRMLEVGNGLAERWDELYKIIFIDENMEESLSIKENMERRHLMSFTMQELQAATNDFSDKIISKDGYNMVYKGWLTECPVAVKRYNSPSLEYYFQKNLDIGRISVHPNIVPVIGFCNTPEEQLLVFRWMHNGSVASWLRGRHESQPPLTWQQRKNIAVDVARGLAYLHGQCEKKIIHRNVKAANILLDENFAAVVADFEAAELLNSYEIKVTTTVTGTMGHIAPEYLATGECSDKTDVFGYGAFLLELITGKETIDLLHVTDDEDMVCADWVKRNYERKWELMVDKETGGSIMEPVVEQLVRIAVLCTQYDPKIRPKMSEVVRMFEVGGLVERFYTRLEKSPDINVEEDNVPPNNNPNSECTISAEHNLFSVLLSRRNPKNYPDYHFGLKSFSLQEIHAATDHFSHKYILVNGCKLYKGRLADGFPVAVERRMPKDRVISLEELEISSIVSHRYVSNAFGFCITKKEQLLVYPYMENGSVASCLRERFVSQHPLSWAIRYRTAIKVARGLRYLHHDCPRPIIHRDIKAANILLDEDFEAFISDFSLAKFMDCSDENDAVRGTIGHIAPEYLASGKCSLKNDVYGYGVFLLELITGQRAFDLARLANDDDVMLLDWVKNVYKDKNFEKVIDQDLEGNFVEEEVRMLFLLAMICTQIDPEQRPMMSEVVKMLEYGGGLAVCENYLANQLRKNSMQILDDKFDDDRCSNLDDDEQLEPR